MNINYLRVSPAKVSDALQATSLYFAEAFHALLLVHSRGFY